MNSHMLQIATRFLAPLLIVLSLVVLYRGHNLPGGGFIGGLLAASAILLQALAFDWNRVQKNLIMDPLLMMVVGLGIAIMSGIPGLISKEAFLAGMWLPAVELPLLGKLKLGTPLLFDVGVYLTVLGFTLKCAIAMGTDMEEASHAATEKPVGNSSANNGGESWN